MLSDYQKKILAYSLHQSVSTFNKRFEDQVTDALSGKNPFISKSSLAAIIRNKDRFFEEIDEHISILDSVDLDGINSLKKITQENIDTVVETFYNFFYQRAVVYLLDEASQLKQKNAINKRLLEASNLINQGLQDDRCHNKSMLNDLKIQIIDMIESVGN